MVKNDKYAQLATMLLERKVIELVDIKPIEKNGLFAVEKDKTKQRLILDAQRANNYLAGPEDSQMLHPGLFTQLQLVKEEEINGRKLDLDDYYYQLELPKEFRPYFELPHVKLNEKLLWPRYRVVPIGWSHLVTIAMAITEDILTSDAHLYPCKRITANAPAKVGRCHFEAYIDDIFVLGTDGKEVTKVYDRILSFQEEKMNKLLDAMHTLLNERY